MVNKAIHTYKYARTGEAKLTIPAESEEAIRGLKVGEVSYPNDVTIKGPKSLPECAMGFITKVFDAVHRTCPCMTPHLHHPIDEAVYSAGLAG